jgi:alcohol dehydrogenase class IV
VLLEDNVTRELVERNFGGEEADLGDVLDVIFRDLGMPRTLTDVGVGRDKMAGLAKNSLKDHWIKTNPKPIEKEEQVMEILEMVAE